MVNEMTPNYLAVDTFEAMAVTKGNESRFGRSPSENLILNKRSLITQERLEKIKNDKEQEELSQLKDKPTINENSKRLASYKFHCDDVVERLTSKVQQRKKKEELFHIEDLYNENKPKPKVAF